MSEDSFTEVTHTSYGGRIKASFKGIIFGLVFFVGAFPLLFWNEGRAVKRYQTLKEGEGAVVSVSPDRVEPGNQGRLVHTMGIADTPETLNDTVFGVSRSAIHLKRTVEMYQWKENRQTRTEKKTGGGEKKVTTYSYTKVWSSSLIDSSAFKRRSGHENPSSVPFETQTITASRVTLGAFVLSPALVREIDNWSPLSIDGSKPVPTALGPHGTASDGGYFRGRDPQDPAIGDLNISFSEVPPGPVSLIAAQQGKSFSAYTTEAGGTINLLQTGNHSASEMFKTAHFHNRLITWGIRIAGLLFMFIGLAMLLKPLSVFADVIPFVGNLVAAGTGLIAFVLAVFFALMVMGAAWIFYRPVLGLSLMAVAVALVVWMVVKKKRAGTAPAVKATLPPVQPASSVPPPQPPRDAPTPVPPPLSPPAPPVSPVSATTPSSADATHQTTQRWIETGKQAYVAGNFDEAAIAFEKAVVLAPDNGTAWYNLGVVRKKTGDTPSAVNAFKQASRLGHQRATKLLVSQNIDW